MSVLHGGYVYPLSDYEDQLNVIGAMIMLGAFILSALVILGGKS